MVIYRLLKLFAFLQHMITYSCNTLVYTMPFVELLYFCQRYALYRIYPVVSKTPFCCIMYKDIPFYTVGWLLSLQCFDTVGWVTGRASGP